MHLEESERDVRINRCEEDNETAKNTVMLHETSGVRWLMVNVRGSSRLFRLYLPNCS